MSVAGGIAISPCPNDTFAFYKLIKSGAYSVDFLDIEELNRALLAKKYQIAKGSFAIMNKIAADYEVLPVGAAIGKGVGPVLVGKIQPGCRIALPGANTTAHRLFRFWQANHAEAQSAELVQMPFYEMLPALERANVDAAVLIHEGRFVYKAAGLELIEDLGAFWERQLEAMVPLGCIYAARSLNPEDKSRFVATLADSMDWAWREYRVKSAVYRDEILPYMQAMAQEKDARVVEAHVDTYVTSETSMLSSQALKSIDAFRRLLSRTADSKEECLK